MSGNLKEISIHLDKKKEKNTNIFMFVTLFPYPNKHPNMVLQCTVQCVFLAALNQEIETHAWLYT